MALYEFRHMLYDSPMQIDVELYRQEVRVSIEPLVRLSVIDISPEQPKRTLVFLHGFGGKASQWVYQLRYFSDANRVIAIDQRGHGRSDKPGGSYSMLTCRPTWRWRSTGWAWPVNSF